MRKTFTFTYILMVIAQMILSNYFHFTPFAMLTILSVKTKVLWSLYTFSLAASTFLQGF